jgi:hypothetical protein
VSEQRFFIFCRISEEPQGPVAWPKLLRKGPLTVADDGLTSSPPEQSVLSSHEALGMEANFIVRQLAE